MLNNSISHVKAGYFSSFNKEPEYIFSSGGRFEVLGNHTDHNHGKCIAATCNLCIRTALDKRDDLIINFISEGFEPLKFDLSNLEHISGNDASMEMIKGVAKYYVDHGYKIGGFDCFSASNIFPGAGVSSSAAFLLLIAKIFNELFNNNEISTLEMCKAGKYSENNYYEKQSGMLDEIGVAYGNLVSIDFEDIDNPIINNIEFPFNDLHFVLVNTGGSHAGLNEEYSSIPNDMYSAARKMGKNFLRECEQSKFLLNPGLFSEIEYSRGKHFFFENKRVDFAIAAMRFKDEKMFLDAINDSRKSSTSNLKNMMIKDNYEGSPLEACDRAMKIMNDEGACKINGGGFAGGIVCFVPHKHLKKLVKEMGKFYGNNNVVEVFIRPNGPIVEK